MWKGEEVVSAIGEKEEKLDVPEGVQWERDEV